jgi:hypothetical protein
MMPAMPPAADETRATRQLLIAIVSGFFAGFSLTLALVTYLIVRYGWPEQRWWVLPDVVQGVVFAVFGGLVAAAAITTLVTRRQHRLGMHRCFTCNHVLANGDEPCICNVEARARYQRRQRVPNRTLHHYRRRLPWVLLVNVIVLLIAWYAVTRPGRPRTAPLVVEVAVLHAVLCILLAALLHLVDCFAPFIRHGRRRGLQVTPYIQLLVMWPAICLILGAIGKALSW